MADFSMITARLATGAGVSCAADVDALKTAGITHVIDGRDDLDSAALFAGSGIIYQWNPTEDDGQPRPDSWWRLNLSFAVAAYAVPGACIYAQCYAGVNRGPSAAYCIMRACWGLPASEAMASIKSSRPVANVRYAEDFERYWAANSGSKGDVVDCMHCLPLSVNSDDDCDHLGSFLPALRPPAVARNRPIRWD
jgi:hypothetical protein